MKKVILALAVVSVSFAACNSGDKKTETPATDSPKVETPAVPVDTATKAPADTAAKAPVADTAAKK
jgi:hypothetical protein